MIFAKTLSGELISWRIQPVFHLLVILIVGGVAWGLRADEAIPGNISIPVEILELRTPAERIEFTEKTARWGLVLLSECSTDGSAEVEFLQNKISELYDEY